MRLLNDCQCLFLLGICEDLNDRIPGIIIINIASILEKSLKSSGKIPLCHACKNLSTHWLPLRFPRYK